MALHPADWLTARRIRIHALLLAIGIWTAYSTNMSAPGMRDRYGLIKGADFLHFYALGNLALEHRGDVLYSMPAQTKLVEGRVPVARGYVYVPLYGPQVSLLFASLARLPYLWALLIWLAANVTIYAASCYAVWKACPQLAQHGWTVFLAALAFPGFVQLIAWGQSSGLALACFTAVYLALRQKYEFLAGLAIGCLAFKPQLGIATALVMLAGKRWKIVAGALLSAGLQICAGWLYYGTGAVKGYAHALTHIADVLPELEPRLYQMHSLRGFWVLLVANHRAAFGLYAVCTVVVLASLLLIWRKQRVSLELQFAALLLASVLVSPHLTVYDLVVLAPAFLLLADWAIYHPAHPAGRSIRGLVYLCFPLFLFGPLVQFVHLQLSVVAMFLLLWAIVRIARAPDASLTPATPATLDAL